MTRDCIRLLEEIVRQKPTRENRLTSLLKGPEEEHAPGWYMCVPPCFNDALDIRFTERVDKEQGRETKTKRRVWTQGCSFAFDKGDTLYDSPDGYKIWAEALKRTMLCVQVKEASPAGAMESGGERFGGSVTFVTLTPDKGRTKIVERTMHTLSQDEFVRFLIEGPSGDLLAQIGPI